MSLHALAVHSRRLCLYVGFNVALGCAQSGMAR